MTQNATTAGHDEAHGRHRRLTFGDSSVQLPPIFPFFSIIFFRAALPPRPLIRGSRTPIGSTSGVRTARELAEPQPPPCKEQTFNNHGSHMSRCLFVNRIHTIEPHASTDGNVKSSAELREVSNVYLSEEAGAKFETDEVIGLLR